MINTSMNFWRELLINLVYLAAVLAVVYILTYTDIVSHLLASWSTLSIEAEIRLEYYSIVPHPKDFSIVKTIFAVQNGVANAIWRHGSIWAEAPPP